MKNIVMGLLILLTAYTCFPGESVRNERLSMSRRPAFATI